MKGTPDCCAARKKEKEKVRPRVALTLWCTRALICLHNKLSLTSHACLEWSLIKVKYNESDAITMFLRLLGRRFYQQRPTELSLIH